MAAQRYLALADRALIRLAGEDARRFLQDIISNDIEKVGPATAIHAALLTPQGKYLHDFFVFEHAHAIHLDCEAARRDDLVRRLKRYRLRAKIDIETADALAPFALLGAGVREMAGPFAGGLVYADPRLADPRRDPAAAPKTSGMRLSPAATHGRRQGSQVVVPAMYCAMVSAP